jgi:hypothetical protein
VVSFVGAGHFVTALTITYTYLSRGTTKYSHGRTIIGDWVSKLGVGG